jgi:hypothetical protein
MTLPDSINEKIAVLLQRLEALETTVYTLLAAETTCDALADLSPDLGVVSSGEFRAGSDAEPGEGFSGMRLLYPPAVYGGETYNLAGLENDDLQFGVRASDGKLLAGGGAVTLDRQGITACAGQIGGFAISERAIKAGGVEIDSTLQRIMIGSGAAGSEAAIGIDLDGLNGVVQSRNFSAGAKGFSLAGSNGDAEFNNLRARGAISALVLEYGSVQGAAGTLGVFKSAGKLRDDITVSGGEAGFDLEIEDPQAGHFPVFAQGDILRIKTVALDCWLLASAPPVDLTDRYRYHCTLQSGGAGEVKAGSAVMDYGPAGSGLITLSADGSIGGSPNISLAKHSGSPWDGLTTLLRIGNLNGYLGYTAERYGVAIGDGARYLKYDPQNGLELRGRAIFGGGAAELNEHGVSVNAGATLTLYVRSDGVDSNDGLSPESALHSVQAAIDITPKIPVGDVIIDIGAGVFAETARIPHIVMLPGCTFTLRGALNEAAAFSDSGAGIKGYADTQGSVYDDAGVPSPAGWESCAGKLISGTGGSNTGVYRLVDSETIGGGDAPHPITLRICGTWLGDPASGDAFSVYDWATTLARLDISGGMEVSLQNLHLSGANGVALHAAASHPNLLRCKFGGTVSLNAQSGASFDTCLFSAASGVSCIASYCDITRSRFVCSSAGLDLLLNSAAYLRAGTVFRSCGVGVMARLTSAAWFINQSAEGYIRLANNTTAVGAALLGCAYGTANNVYSANTVNESASAASYGYID